MHYHNNMWWSSRKALQWRPPYFTWVSVLLLFIIPFAVILSGTASSSFSLFWGYRTWRTRGILSPTSLTNAALNAKQDDERFNIVKEIPHQPPSNRSSSSVHQNGSFNHQNLLQPSPAEGEEEGKNGKEELESKGGHGRNSTSEVAVKRYSKRERVEAVLAKARSAIREAARNGSMISTHHDPDYVPQGPIYHNANAFHRSYLEMEKEFKIYVYSEGEPPIFHNGPCRSIYSTEGRFIHQMEKGNLFRTKDPDEALVYFLPFSVVVMVRYLYVPGAHDMHPIGRTIADYINVISSAHPFWNRSLGLDHFMLSCHDWGPYSTTYVPNLFNNSIRVLCNANTSEGFNPRKDVSLPEINLKTGEIFGLLGGPSPSRRSILAFFAGGLHGHIRHLLLDRWKGKDEDILVYEKLPGGGPSYESMLKNSRYCLCPSGYEVASPRIVEAIYAECVPVLISDGYVPPFSDVLNWKAFSVTVEVKDIENLKTILMGISQRQYLRMHRRVKQVQRHFVINGPPKRFDLFHMIVHSIWLRRLNVRVHDR
ncbi:probable glycosyltransferase At5g03795 [Ipomoea triloba]|uniref:probable glycosyltransferase At5g03795 n=1 Tax=Ipomoea triloba TaxID=35885 RepID=UPI00125CF33E|nr:probable glycosyltransferase At5g03795 [Ipomoea triloba]